MEKKHVNYTIYPTIAPVSLKDARVYQVETVSKEELIQRIEILESEKIPKLEAEISHLKQVEQRMIAMEAVLAQLTRGNAPSSAASTKETVFSKLMASISTTQVSATHQLKKGDSYTFGKYQGEPVEWQVLDVEDGKALLLSRYGLDAKPYDEGWKNVVTWEKSTLRKWLNHEFYKNAFSTGEQNRILRVNLVNADTPHYGTTGGNNTEDQVFLLSIDDAQKYFMGDSARKCTLTAYAKKQGASVDKNIGTCWWWLRSSGNGSKYAALVSSDGSVYSYGNRVGKDGLVVRPALWINLES